MRDARYGLGSPAQPIPPLGCEKGRKTAPHVCPPVSDVAIQAPGSGAAGLFHPSPALARPARSDPQPAADAGDRACRVRQDAPRIDLDRTLRSVDRMAVTRRIGS